MKNNPELQNGFAEESERLKDVFERKHFYFDTTLCDAFSCDPSKNTSLLPAIYADCKRSNESCKIRIQESEDYKITKKDFTTIAIVYKDIFGASTVWETTYYNDKSIEFIDINS